MHRCVQMKKTKRVDHALYKENEKTNVLSSIRSDFEMMGVCSTHITHGTHERLLHKSLCNCWAVNSGKTGEGRSMILTRKRQMFCPLLSKAERRNQEEEEYTSQVHFSSWKDHGSCPENYFQPCKGKSSLTNLTAACDEMMAYADEGRGLDGGCIGFSDYFNAVRHKCKNQTPLLDMADGMI